MRLRQVPRLCGIQGQIIEFPGSRLPGPDLLADRLPFAVHDRKLAPVAMEFPDQGLTTLEGLLWFTGGDKKGEQGVAIKVPGIFRTRDIAQRRKPVGEVGGSGIRSSRLGNAGPADNTGDPDAPFVDAALETP